MRVRQRNLCLAWVSIALFNALAKPAVAEDFFPRVRQITFGPRHHFFGYIGQSRTIPWNQSGQYILALSTTFQDHMPGAGEAAEIVLLDARDNYAVKNIDRTRGWNLQQGTMFYWNPLAAETQFFFNDRDPKTNRVFAVLYDLGASPRADRRREYRFVDTPVGNSGVSPAGGKFAAINYGRLARLRSVTGYPGAYDWTDGTDHPTDDGVFVVDVASGDKKLLVSFSQLADRLRPTRPTVDGTPLFINHTLWSPDGKRLFFFCRGHFDNRDSRIDAPFVINADGTGLIPLKQSIGGHPEWLDAERMLGRWDRRQGIYDMVQQRFTGALGDADTFADPGGDISLSPDGRWLANGASVKAENHYTFFRLADGRTVRAGPLDRGRFTSGDLRIDTAPCWNRTGSAVLCPGIASSKLAVTPEATAPAVKAKAESDDGTRSIFSIELNSKSPPGELPKVD